MAEELGEVIKRFAAAPQAEREMQRHAFSAQIASLLPSKGSLVRFVTKLIKAPAPAQTGATSQAGVYVLRLEDGSYYVGESTNKDARVAQHRAGQGASFTAALGATAVREEPLTKDCGGDLEAWERAETLERMHKHGIVKVRGWIFTTPVMSPDQHEEAFRQVCSRKKLCATCGSYGHFASTCYKGARAQWAR